MADKAPMRWVLISVALLAAACTNATEFSADPHVITTQATDVGAPESLPAMIEGTRVGRSGSADPASNEAVTTQEVKARIVERIDAANAQAANPTDSIRAWSEAAGPPSEQWLAPGIGDDDSNLAGSSIGSTQGSASPTPQQPTSAAPAPANKMDLYRGVLGGYSRFDVLAAISVSLPTVSAGTAPLTGLTGSVPERRAVVVKVDNTSKARPQTGLDLADVVVEQEVEWGLTRLAAIFHSNQAPVVGPVRSARSTDISFLQSLGSPALVYSGANVVFDELLLRLDGVQNFSAARTGGYWRDSSRRAPSNLYTDSRNFDGGGASPGAWFHYSAGPVSIGAASSSVTVNFPSTSVQWDWDGSRWLRRQDGKRHTSADGSQLSAMNVVVVEVEAVDSGLVDPAGSVVPEFVWAGSGRASVFTNGRRIDGTWTRPTLNDPAVLVNAAGDVIELTPGVTWVEMVRSLP